MQVEKTQDEFAQFMWNHGTNLIVTKTDEVRRGMGLARESGLNRPGLDWALPGRAGS